MDRQKEERERGVTISCTTKEFFTDLYHYTIIDAPGAARLMGWRVGSSEHCAGKQRQAVHARHSPTACLGQHSSCGIACLLLRVFSHNSVPHLPAPHLAPTPQAIAISSRT